MDGCSATNSPATQSPHVVISTRTSIFAQPEQDQVCINSTAKQARKTVDDTKFKTELCKKFEMTGFCPYFTKCRFAHGKEELNEKGIAQKKKFLTRKCKNFHSVMNCPYGTRCMFAHEVRTVQELKNDYSLPTLNYTQMFEQGFLGSKRMNCFSQVAEDEVLAKRSDLAKQVFTEAEGEFEDILNLCVAN